MPLYSLKVQTLVARWKLFRSSSSAIFVDDAVPQWLLYCVCGHKKRFDQLFSFCGQKGQLQLKFITGDETWVHQYCPETSAIHDMEASTVSHHQKIQDINQLWETDGNSVLGHA